MSQTRPYIDYHDICEALHHGFITPAEGKSIISQLNGIYNEYSIHANRATGSDQDLSGNA